LVTEIQTLAQTRREVQRLPALKEEVTGARIKLRELRQPFKGYYRVCPVRLRLVGPFPEVQVFLDKLEALPIYVRDLHMGPVEEGAGIEAEVKLELFFRPVAPAAPPQQVSGVVPRNPFVAPPEAVSSEPQAATPGDTAGAQIEVKGRGGAPEGGAGESAAVAASPKEVSDGRRQKEEATTPEASYIWPKGEEPDAFNRQYTFPVRR
jgi:hypothetical protein